MAKVCFHLKTLITRLLIQAGTGVGVTFLFICGLVFVLAMMFSSFFQRLIGTHTAGRVRLFAYNPSNHIKEQSGIAPCSFSRLLSFPKACGKVDGKDMLYSNYFSLS